MIPTAALPHTISIERYLGSTAYGPTWAPAEMVRTRLTGRRRAVKNASGVDVIADATAILRPGQAVPAESRVTDATGRVFTVIGVTDNPGLVRGHNTELILAGARPSGGA